MKSTVYFATMRADHWDYNYAPVGKYEELLTRIFGRDLVMVNHPTPEGGGLKERS